MARKMSKDVELDEDGNPIEKPKRGRPRRQTVSFENVSDDTIRECCEKSLALKLELEKIEEKARAAKGRYRSSLKRAEGLGVDQKTITEWIADRKLEPDEVIRKERWKRRLYGVMQLELFEAGESETMSESKTEETKLQRSRPSRSKYKGPDLVAAYALGHDAGLRGEAPKKAAKGLTGAARAEFAKGWDVGQKEAASRKLEPEGATAGQA